MTFDEVEEPLTKSFTELRRLYVKFRIRTSKYRSGKRNTDGFLPKRLGAVLIRQVLGSDMEFNF